MRPRGLWSATAEALGIDPRPPIERWRADHGVYRCPYCSSSSVARERNVTTRYPAPTTQDVEKIIRCVDCGESEEEDEI